MYQEIILIHTLHYNRKCMKIDYIVNIDLNKIKFFCFFSGKILTTRKIGGFIYEI